ncbi:MAG TPA: tetratricopeptide repeat protein [Candidatus Acidoferrales bacterium]|jgi:tetratricopeptide (TPR) repeat protein|nr:tetratricopeptide repeat protein [Candidatus Acidoferrales bacterium]
MFISRFPILLAACLGALLLGGCASSIEQWIVNTRVHQGKVALVRGNAPDAALAFKLALRVDPKNPQARAGYVEAAGELARLEYTKGNFDDALATVNAGLAVDPESARLAAMKASIDQAKLQREIVISNYPTYHAAGLELQRAYQQLNVTNSLVLHSLKRFGYTFDATDLVSAIKRSYQLQLELAKNTNRLLLYRQLVTSGVPEAPSQSTTFGAASLLPLP